MADPRVMISVPEGVREWLREEAERLEKAYEAGWYECPAYNPSPANPSRPHVSLADVIEMMLEERRQRRARRRKAKAKRRAAKAGDGRQLLAGDGLEPLGDGEAW